MQQQTHLFEQLRLPGLDQWFTPEWAAAMLVEQYFPELSAAHLVLEAGCGPGAFLKAIPAIVPAVGIEIDPVLADEARLNSGRQVLTGDFLTVALPDGITHVVGNPPFKTRMIARLLARLHRQLPDGGRVGWILPAYLLQSHKHVCNWSDQWAIKAELLPRQLFERLRHALVFAQFTRSRSRLLVGFALYREAREFDNLAAAARQVMRAGRTRRSVWRAVVEEALERLGGDATLPQIYEAIEPCRPTANAFWREKVRQTLQFYCHSSERGVWRLRA